MIRFVPSLFGWSRWGKPLPEREVRQRVRDGANAQKVARSKSKSRAANKRARAARRANR